MQVNPKDLSDIEVLARTIWGEARGEGLLGMTAVACVVMNRVSLAQEGKVKWWGEGIKGVCLKPYQFSCWNKADPNYKLLTAPTVEGKTYTTAEVIARLASMNCLKDITDGATHYFSTKVLTGDDIPDWASGRKPTKTINNHVFYRIV